MISFSTMNHFQRHKNDIMNTTTNDTKSNQLASTSTKSFAGKGLFPRCWAFVLLLPFRKFFHSPKRLIERLEINCHSTVLEIGPGPGFFSVEVARCLTNGKLVLADIQQEMLDYAKKRLTRRRMTNVEYYLCRGEEFDLPDTMFDAVFMVMVLGEVPNKDVYLRECYRMLKLGGILSISEHDGDPDILLIEEVRSLAEHAGFVFHKIYGKERNYTVNFKKP